MASITEVEILTETKKRLVAQKALGALNPGKAYARDTIASSATVLSECGGQAVVAFRAIIGSYGISRRDKQGDGFTVHPDFKRATGLGDRQFRRAVQRLAAAGFIEADKFSGRKPRILLTDKGKRALINPSREPVDQPVI